MKVDLISKQRVRLRGLVVGTLQTLADQNTDLAQAIEYTRRLLVLEPWREEAHRQLMQRLARSGQVNAALTHYEICPHAIDTQQALGIRANEPIVPHNLSRLANILYQQGGIFSCQWQNYVPK